MDTYSLLREIADSWVLLAMFAFFVGAAIFAFLPSQSKAREDASMIPMRDEAAPRGAGRDKPAKTCSGACDDCAASADTAAMRGLSNG
jgi:cytochrome c oxidase cbb3-type subunit 4